MRPLEILLASLVGIYLVGSLTPLPIETELRTLPLLAMLVIILHLFTEKYRWQMVLLYALGGILFFRVTLYGSQGGQSIAWSMGGLLLLLPAIILPAILPVPKPTPPRGPHRVGTRTYALVDGTREELYSGKREPRRIIIQIWYPALIEHTAKQAAWMPGAKPLARAISKWLKFPPFFLDHISLARSNSYLDAPIDRSATPFPLLFFSHGWGGFRAQNTYQVQELASHGYVVVGMEHPYGAVMSLFPDGSLIPINHDALPYQQPGLNYDVAARQLGQQWAKDISFALDFMSRMNAQDTDGSFKATLDLQKVGVLGHSTGGGAIAQFCANDPRCKAGFAEDIYMPPISEKTLEEGLKKPFATMFSQVWSEDVNSGNNQLFHQLADRSSPRPISMHIVGTNHYDFTDLPALSPLAHTMGLKGPIQGKRVQKIINSYSLAFFDWQFKGGASSLLEQPSPQYPEVIFDSVQSPQGGIVKNDPRSAT